jgi:hypothetical protein
VNYVEKREVPALGGQGQPTTSEGGGNYDRWRSQDLPNQWRRTSPRVSLQCQLNWDEYRLEKLPPDSPRRRPTLAKVRFLDGGDR